MRIRRCANLLLGAAVTVSAPPQFELPPSSPRFELPPPAHESRAGPASKTSSSSPEPCSENFYPWDLFGQLDPSDPQEEERFMETYSVPAVRRASWFLPASMSAGFIKEDDEDMVNVVKDEDDLVNVVNDEEEEDMAVESILEPCVPKDAGRKTARKKKESKQKTRKGKEKAEESDDSGGGGGRGPWTCKKNDGKGWFCRRPVSQPDSLCSYHSEPKLPSTLKPRRKRATAFGDAVGEGFYYYAGFGPSRSKRYRGSSSRSVPEPAPAEEKEEAIQLPEEHIDVSLLQTKDDAADGVDDEPRCDEDDMAGIAGCDEEISSDDDVKRGNSPVKKRWRKPVKARSVNSLM